jgi:glycosyltransferase involved in cell wall biosynthesis
MKLLVLQSELGVLRGGGENFTRNLLTAFAGRGHHVVAAFTADRKARYSIPMPTAIQPIPIPGWWSRNFGQATLASVRRRLPRQFAVVLQFERFQQGISWRAARAHDKRFQKRIEEEFASRWKDFDVVYVHSNVFLASKIACYRPTVLRLPGPCSAELMPVLSSVPVVCANGDALARIRTFLGEHAVELPIGVDTDRFRPEGDSVRKGLGWTNEDQVMGYVGRLTHLKGVDLLADAFRKISSHHGNAKLLIIGDGAEGSYIRKVLAREYANGKVHMEANVDHQELPSRYRTMDFLVMPSRYENFSNALLEAMACGIPFLASDTGGNRLLSITGAGRFFEPASVSSLVSGMRTMLEDKAETKARGDLAVGYARDSLSWAACAERLEEIIISRLKVKA